MNHHKEVYIIGGPNGAGKTTFVREFLPEYIKVRNFINADDIAFGLSPLDSQAMNIRSGRIMLELIEEYKSKGVAFGFETTLAGRKWISLIDELKNAGYTVYIFFLDLLSINLSLSRVRYRIEAGGHAIPEETVRRRYGRSRQNFWNNYKNMSNKWYLFDNSGDKPELVATGLEDQLNIIDKPYLDFFLASIKGE